MQKWSESEWAKKPDFEVAMFPLFPSCWWIWYWTRNASSHISVCQNCYVQIANDSKAKPFEFLSKVNLSELQIFLIFLHWLCELVNWYGLLRLSSNLIQCPPTTFQSARNLWLHMHWLRMPSRRCRFEVLSCFDKILNRGPILGFPDAFRQHFSRFRQCACLWYQLDLDSFSLANVQTNLERMHGLSFPV